MVHNHVQDSSLMLGVCRCFVVNSDMFKLVRLYPGVCVQFMAGSVIFRIVRLCPGVRVQCMAGSIMFKIVCLMSTSLCSVYGRFYNVQDSLPYVHQAMFSLWPVLLCSR